MVVTMSQPHFWKSVRMTFTLLKWGLGSPPRLAKLQSSIEGVKTPHLKTFFISLKSCQSLDVENGLAWTIWTFATQVMTKKGLKVWLPITKSRELTRPQCVQVECNTPLESSQGELQVCFKLQPNRRSEQRVMNSQSLGSLNRNSFETPPWESQNKKPFSYGCHGVTQRILYGGRWWLPSNLGRG